MKDGSGSGPWTGPAWPAIALGGVLGTGARWGLEEWLAPDAGAFPIATFLANIAGAFVLGLAVVLLVERWHSTASVRGFLLVGVLGSFTTFSKYAVDGIVLAEAGRMPVAAAYWLLSVVVGMAAGVLGLRAARSWRT